MTQIMFKCSDRFVHSLTNDLIKNKNTTNSLLLVNLKSSKVSPIKVLRIDLLQNISTCEVLVKDNTPIIQRKLNTLRSNFDKSQKHSYWWFLLICKKLRFPTFDSLPKIHKIDNSSIDFVWSSFYKLSSYLSILF